MQADNESPRQRTLEHEIDICPSIFRHIALADHAFLLELLVGELVGTELLVFLLFP